MYPIFLKTGNMLLLLVIPTYRIAAGKSGIRFGIQEELRFSQLINAWLQAPGFTWVLSGLVKVWMRLLDPSWLRQVKTMPYLARMPSGLAVVREMLPVNRVLN